MSDKSANLKLPFIHSAQAQKHVTHNDAITNLDVLTQLTVEDKDLSTPPSSPTEGTCYIIASSATAEWAGKENQMAAWQDGTWRFYEPAEGWVAWIRDEDTQAVFDGSLWNELTASGGGGNTNLNPVTGDLLGVNATADTTNKFSVNSDATLFNHNGSDHQLKINKNANADNASVMFQTAFSGRAEFGLTGDDDFHMKVSPDGTTFHEGIVIDKDTGAVTFPNTTFSGGSVSSVFGRAGAVVATAGDYSFNEIGGVSQNVLIGRLTSGTGAQEALSASQVRSFLNIEDNATGDQTGSEIKTVLFAEADTNNFDDAQQSKLSAIEPLADVTDETSVIASLNGSTLTGVTVAGDDKVIIQDLSDSDNIKTVTAQSIADLNAGNNGDVIGPASATDFRIAMFDGSTGKLIKELDAGTAGQFLKSQGDGSTPVWDNISGGGDLLSTNNLSDISNAETARSNLGLEIGVDVAAATSSSSEVSSDILALALKVADLEGDTLEIIDGIADPFNDETDVDTSVSTGAIYNASNDLYSSDSNEVSGGHSDGSQGGAGVTYLDRTWALMNGNTVNSLGVYSTDAQNITAKIAKRNSAGNYDIVASEVFSHTGTGWEYVNLATPYVVPSSGNYHVCSHCASNINRSSQSVARSTFVGEAIGTTVSMSESTGNTSRVAARYAATNILLQSEGFTANTAPSSARLLFQIKPLDSIIINTDVIGEVSRDGGATFTSVTLIEKIAYSNGTKLFESEAVDLSGQPSGTSMKWKLETANNKSVEIRGAVLQWS
ncbi:MAG: DUF2793 domain-containing protein [Hyphomicrobiales bacterium]